MILTQKQNVLFEKSRYRPASNFSRASEVSKIITVRNNRSYYKLRQEKDIHLQKLNKSHTNFTYNIPVLLVPEEKERIPFNIFNTIMSSSYFIGSAEKKEQHSFYHKQQQNFELLSVIQKPLNLKS